MTDLSQLGNDSYPDSQGLSNAFDLRQPTHAWEEVSGRNLSSSFCKVAWDLDIRLSAVAIEVTVDINDLFH